MLQAQQGGPPRFPSNSTALEVAQTVLRDLVDDLQRRSRAARGSDDPERTHKFRVSVRRLRTGLRLFRPLLPRERVEPIEADLRWLFRRLGAVREFDVLFAALSQEDDPDTASDETSIRPELAARRQRAARAARRALRSKRYVRLQRALRKLPSALVSPATEPLSARRWARKRLRKRLSRVRELRARGAERDESERHELRKQTKKLRYAVELLAPLFARRRVKAYLAPLTELQDVLGDMNDEVVSRRLLREARAPHLRRQDDAVAAGGASKKSLRKLKKRLRAFDEATPFWQT